PKKTHPKEFVSSWQFPLRGHLSVLHSDTLRHLLRSHPCAKVCPRNPIFRFAKSCAKSQRVACLSSNQSTHPRPLPSAEARPHDRNPAATPRPSAYQTSRSATDTPRTHLQSTPAPAALRGAGRCSRAPPAAHSHSPRTPAPPSPRPPSPRSASELRSPHTTAPTHSPLRSNHARAHASRPAHEMLNSVHKTHGHTSQAEPSAHSAISAYRSHAAKRCSRTCRSALDPQSTRRRLGRRAPPRLGNTLSPLVSRPMAARAPSIAHRRHHACFRRSQIHRAPLRRRCRGPASTLRLAHPRIRRHRHTLRSHRTLPPRR